MIESGDWTLAQVDAHITEESPCRSEPSRLLEQQLVGLRERGSSALSLLLRASLWRWVCQLCTSTLKPPHRVWLQSQRCLNKCVMCDGRCYSRSTSSSLRNQGNLSNSLDQPVIFEIISLIFPIFRRRRTKLQAHLKESRSLKNYAVNAHSGVEAKTRAPDVPVPMHEVKVASSTSTVALQDRHPS